MRLLNTNKVRGQTQFLAYIDEADFGCDLLTPEDFAAIKKQIGSWSFTSHHDVLILPALTIEKRKRMKILETSDSCVLSIKGDSPIGKFEIDKAFTTDVCSMTQRHRVFGFVRRISRRPGYLIRSVEWGGKPLNDPALYGLIHEPTS